MAAPDLEWGMSMALADLRSRWRTLCASCGICDEHGVWELLGSGYASAGRHYHNWAHIADCLSLLDELRPDATDFQAVELALWFHDAVYDSRRGDNEEQSALQAEKVLSTHPRVDSIGAMIRATVHRAAPADADTALLCDIDLSILAAEPARYDGYASAIRREYAWVGEAEYRAGRAKVLQSFLQRPLLYVTTACRFRWEDAARSNLEREIASLA